METGSTWLHIIYDFRLRTVRAKHTAQPANMESLFFIFQLGLTRYTEMTNKHIPLCLPFSQGLPNDSCPTIYPISTLVGFLTSDLLPLPNLPKLNPGATL